MATSDTKEKKPTAAKAADKPVEKKAAATADNTSAAFAVIETGGKQYKVAAGDTITIEKLADNATGDAVTFANVLLMDDGKATTLGAPYVKGATVKGTLTEEGRARKISVIRYKSKSRYFKRKGHRQPFVKVKIDSISA
jgi:large subunit ribosomal protein L21